MRPEIHDYLKNMAMQVGAGGTAGFIEVSIMHPLDLVKTRLQIQSKHVEDPLKQYHGIRDCVRKMYAREGFLAFYKGIVPPMIVETPKRATKFLTYEQYKQFFLFGSPTPTALTHALAGMFAGITEAILVNPFEVIKVTLQSNSLKAAEAPSTWEVTRTIVQTQGVGLKGLNKAVVATMYRNAIFNSIYFGFYHSVKDAFPTQEDAVLEFLRKLSIGVVSGVMGSVCNIPFDVVKSRIQGPQPVLGQIKYSATFPTLAMIYREEGPQALFKGLLPKILRLGPGCGIMMLTYEYVYEFLREKFPNEKRL